MAGSFPTGRFIWYECMAADAAEAQEFYKAVTGWSTNLWDGGPEPYTMWMNGERAIGGVLKLPEDAAAAGVPPHWMGYVATPDVDTTVAKARELGAEILVDVMEIPEVGKFAVLQDPQGAVISPYTPAADPPGQAEPPGERDFSWHELATSNLEEGFQFYQALFGWEKKDSMDMGEHGLYQMYGRPGEPYPLGGIYKKPAEMPGPPHWLYYISIPNLDAALATVTAKGGKILNGPEEVPGGDRVAQCMDPQGAVFALHEVKKENL